MKRLLRIGLIIVLILGSTSIYSQSQEREPMKKGVGPAPFYLSIKDKIGITKEQEDKLMAIEKEASKKLGEITSALMKVQQSLNAVTREEEVDLVKARMLLKNIAILESGEKFIFIEATALEKKVLTKEQRIKAEEIAREIVRKLQQK